MLARQIEQGAPYDVYLSANERFVADLAASGHLVPGTVRVYAVGRIALWSQEGVVRSLDGLDSARVRHVAIANPSHAPYGQAAKEALENKQLWRKLERKIVFGENVRQALQFAESGNADAAITAWSLVFASGGVLLPQVLHSPIRQGAGAVAGSRHPEWAARFLEFLTGPDAQKLLRQYGFFPAVR
jgi:molybdate transport system substrate-binding protein